MTSHDWFFFFYSSIGVLIVILFSIILSTIYVVIELYLFAPTYDIFSQI